jgi:F0F1-type ATP synthase membrane subunit b/b'
MQTLIAPFINLLILIGVLAFYLRKPLQTFAETRHHTIREDLESVRNQLRGAQEKNAEFSAKLRAVDAEVSGIKTQMIQDAQAMKSRIVTEAQKLSSNVIDDARHASAVLYTEFKSSLYSELGARVLDRAEAILKERLTGDDRARMRKEFSSQVETAQ